jgi:serine/threonine-protein kinase
MGYLAPDVLAGGAAGPAGDVFALGVAAFAGLTGSMPHPAGSIAELVVAASQTAPLVSSVAPDLGNAFDESVAAALDPDPTKRPDALSLVASLTTALGRWSRARQGLATAAGRPRADADATTAIVAIPPAAAGANVPAGPRTQRVEPRAPTSRGNLVAAAIVGGLVVAAIALLAGLNRDAGRAGSSAAANAAASVSPSPPPSVTPSPSPAPPSAAPTASVASRALAALDGVDAAIAAARGEDGLKNKDANDLLKRARDIRSALNDGDLDQAAEAASSLANAVNKLGDEMDEDLFRRLEDAVAAVVDILRDRG